MPQRPTWLGGKKEEPGPKVITPKDKMEQLRELSTNSKKMTPELQLRISEELAQGIAHEQDPVLRAQVLRTLGHFPNEKAGSMLAAGLHDGERDVRIAACEGLGRHGGQLAATELARVLAEDADIDVRLAAARGLGQAKVPASMPALADALEDQDPAMQHRVIASMKQISGKDLGNDLGAWREFAKSGQTPPEPSIATRIRNWFR
ncbi:MAG: HEAT repeat domain-containing protein [Singulisphaera sp.]